MIKIYSTYSKFLKHGRILLSQGTLKRKINSFDFRRNLSNGMMCFFNNTNNDDYEIQIIQHNNSEDMNTFSSVFLKYEKESNIISLKNTEEIAQVFKNNELSLNPNIDPIIDFLKIIIQYKPGKILTILTQIFSQLLLLPQNQVLSFLKQNKYHFITTQYRNLLELNQSDKKVQDIRDITEIISKLRSSTTSKSKKLLIQEYLQEVTNEMDLVFFLMFAQSNSELKEWAESLLKHLSEISKSQQSTSETNEKNSNFVPVLGKPIPVMLGRPAVSIQELPKLFKKWGSKVIIENKYDGERTQIHYDKQSKSISLYSRSQELQNTKFEQLVQDILLIFEKYSFESCILDGEILAIDKEGQFLPFSEIKRKFIPKYLRQNIEDIFASKRFKIKIFDIIYWKNKFLNNLPLLLRKNQLKNCLKDISNSLVDLIEYKEVDLQNPNYEEVVLSSFNEAKLNGCEGIMLKSFDSQLTFYDFSGGRTQWSKFKGYKVKDGILSIETLDLVPIGVNQGKGKREKYFGSFLVAAFDHQSNKFKSICRIGTGLKDVDLRKFTEFFESRIISERPEMVESVPGFLKPDFWVEPTVVWEIGFESFSKSPSYNICKENLSGTGLSLRFPRFIREREDKKIGDSTSTNEIWDLYVRMEREYKNKYLK